MKRENCDLFVVLPHHLSIHDRLGNWSRYVRVNGRHARLFGRQPMFEAYRSSEVWGNEGSGVPVDQIDGHKIEKAVGQLPEKHRDAIRWHYVYVWIQPGRMQRHLGVTRPGLMDLIHDGRSMLKNRSGA